MPRQVFDVEQYELRGSLPQTYSDKQKETLNKVVSRVNGQLDWTAQLLGFNGPNYWGSQIPTVDGSYKWKGLPQTVSEKRALQAGAFGVYNKDKEYSQRPAPFRRDEVRASADQSFLVYERDGRTELCPYGQVISLTYKTNPYLIAGGSYTFNELVDVEVINGKEDQIYVVQDLDQQITQLRILDNDVYSVSVVKTGSFATPVELFVQPWEDISDWKSDEVLSGFTGVWGNKGNQLSQDLAFDALDLHGFNENEALSLDDIRKCFSVSGLLDLIGLSPAPMSAFNDEHYEFHVEGCEETFLPTLSLETKILNIVTQEYDEIETELGFILSADDGVCAEVEFTRLQSDGQDPTAGLYDNGTFEATVAPSETLSNGEYPSTATDTISDGGFYFGEPADILLENGDFLAISQVEIDTAACYAPPDPEFGVCDTPNYTVTLIQHFDTEPNEIATDPGPETSTALGCNGVSGLDPLGCSTDNGLFENGPTPEFLLNNGDYPAVIPPEGSAINGFYDQDPLSICDESVDAERYIDFDDLIIDVDGNPGPVLFTDPGANNEIVLIASGTLEDGYDGFSLGFDGLEFDEFCFDYHSKTPLGNVDFPCIEWIFDPTLDNSTYAPTPAEAAWMGADDGEFDRDNLDRRVPFAVQSAVECVGLQFISGFLSFDDGEFDEKIQPFCDDVDPSVCEIADGEIYTVGNPLRPPAVNTVCASECGTIDNGGYVYGRIPYVGPTLIDGNGSADIKDDCVLYDGEEYDRVVAPEIACVGYDNGLIGVPAVESCRIEDSQVFDAPLTSIKIDQGEYSDAYFPTVCTPCGEPLPDPQCYLDNGVIDGPPITNGDTDEGLYDKGVLLCTPCDPNENPPVPCPPDPVRVRLDQIIFSSPIWRMQPSVLNSKTPLRVWKNRILTVSENTEFDEYVNGFIADANRGPEDPSAYRHFVRLPAEYPRNGKFWTRAEAVCSNFEYFSRPPELSQTAVAPIEIPPVLYQEAYYLTQEEIPDTAVFYDEPFLVSTFREDTLDPQSGFSGARVTFEETDEFYPFAYALLTDYDALSERRAQMNGEWRGTYYKWEVRRLLTGYIETDISDLTLRPATSGEDPIGDASPLIFPNVEFPDIPDTASFSNYTVAYAYFTADLSAADDPVFDPSVAYCHRERCIDGKQDDSALLTTESELEILTEDGNILRSAPEVLGDSCLDTNTAYLLHPEVAEEVTAATLFPARPPRSRSSAIITPNAASLTVACGSQTFTVLTVAGVTQNYEYQWQFRLASGGGWVEISDDTVFSGATTDTLTFSPQSTIYDGALIRVIIDSSEDDSFAISNSAEVTVSPAEILIETQPQNTSVVSCNTVSLTVTAESNCSEDVLVYQWQQLISGVWTNITDGGQFAGTTTNALAITPDALILNGASFRALISGSVAAPQVESEAAILTVLAGNITITPLPGSVSVYLGDCETVTASATSNDCGDLSYEWQVNTGAGWTTVTGQTYDNGGDFPASNPGVPGPSSEILMESGDELATDPALESEFVGTDTTISPSGTLDDGFYDETVPATQTINEGIYDRASSQQATGPIIDICAYDYSASGYKYRVKVCSSGTAPCAYSNEMILLVLQPPPPPLPVFGLTWETTVDNPCDPTPWSFSNQNQSIRYTISDSENCGGSCNEVQAGTATATITVGAQDVNMGLAFTGIGELQDSGFEMIRFLLDGVEVGSGESRDEDKGCDEFGAIAQTFITPPPYLLAAGTTHTLLIDFTTGDPLFHVGCFYDVNLSFTALP